MGENETREIGVLFDWKRDNVVKDWSVTAWGTTHDVVVRHANYPSVKSDKMPEHTDSKEGVTPPQPIPDEGGDEGGDGGNDDGTCTNLDNGALDSYGDNCAAYVGNQDWCGEYDDGDFKSNEMCCACGGGNREEDGEEEEEEDDGIIPDEEEEDDGTIPDEGEGECTNLDNGATDSYGDACAAYEGYPDWCGEYDDDDFNSKEMCCACGGGNKGGDGDDGTTPDEEEEDDGTIPDEEEAEMYFDMYNYNTEGDSANVLCIEEFEMFFMAHCTTCPWDSAQRILAYFDKNEDGCLSREEFTELFKNMNDESMVPDEDET